MSSSVDQVLTTYSHAPLGYDNDTTSSVKEWTRSFAPFVQLESWAPTMANIGQFLGPGDNGSRADFIGYATPCEWPNMLPQLVETEGDVTRDFDQSIIPPVAAAFCGEEARTRTPSGLESGGPTLFSRSQLAASGSTKVIDFQMVMHHEIPLLDMPAMIGEMKKPRTIRREEWVNMDRRSSVTTRLQSELRAYAYEYACPQIFIFDSMSLVIVQFRASSVEDIASSDCIIDCCVVPREANRYHDQCTIQSALYRLAWRGWVRLCSNLATKDSTRSYLSLHYKGLKRKHIFYSGDPYWVDSRNRRQSAPLRRAFLFTVDNQNNPEGFWVWKSGDQVVHFDTQNCFICRYRF